MEEVGIIGIDLAKRSFQEGERELVRRLVARRFGERAAKDFVPVLAGISDSDRLAAIAADAFTCETAGELAKRARGDGTAE